MSLTSIFAGTVFSAVTKLLFKAYLGEEHALLGDGIADFGKDVLKDELDRKKVDRDIQEIADKVVRKLSASLKRADLSDAMRETLADRLGRTLTESLTTAPLAASELDAAKLTEQFRSVARTIPGAPSPPADVVFDRLLQEAARYLVGIATTFPQFQREAAEYSVRQLGEIKGTLDTVLDRLERIETRTESLGGDEKNLEYEKNYRAAVLQHLDWVELFGVDLPASYRQIPLKDAFVSLDLERDDEAIRTRTCEAVLNEFRPGAGRLLIEGVAGSGKTTLMRWVAITAAPLTEMARVRRERWGHLGGPDSPNALRILDNVEQVRLHADWRNRVPFLIILRNCPDGRLPEPDDLPTLLAHEIGKPPPEWARRILKDGRALVLIDGVDEVPQFKRDELFREIKALTEAYPPDNYFLITTRPDVVPDGWLKPIGFRQVTVSPMAPDGVDGFVDQWHSAYARKLTAEGKPTDLVGKAAKLKRNLRWEPPLAQLATNPLMCGMICALNDYRQDYLPRNLPELCEALCDMFLHRRDESRGLSTNLADPEYHKLDVRQKRAILKQLAVLFMDEGRSAVEEPVATKLVANELGAFPGCDPARAREVLRGLIERTGMLRESKPAQYRRPKVREVLRGLIEWTGMLGESESAQYRRPVEIEFIHNTFKEYLAGEWYATAERVNRLLEKLEDQSWQRVALFAVGTDQERAFAGKVIRKLIENQDERRLVFALQCRSMVTYLDQDVGQELDRVSKKLFPPKSMKEAEALAVCGEAVVPFLGYRPTLRANEAAACARVLVLVGTERAREALEDYCKDSRQTVADSLIKYVSPLKLSVFLEKICRGATLDAEVRSRITDLSGLSNLTALRTLDLSWCVGVADLSPLAGLPNLQILDLSGCGKVTGLSPLSNLPALQTLRLSGCVGVTGLSPLAGLPNLQTLDLSGCVGVTDLSPLAGLPNLQALHLFWCVGVTDLSPLAKLPALQTLHLSGCAGVTDLSPLAGLGQLRELNVGGTRITDFKPVQGKRGLKIAGRPTLAEVNTAEKLR